jgi:phenylalanyl-tRNA synthetase alpha subunit
MIGSNLPPLQYVDGLKRSLESGKVTAGKIQVANATAEIQAQIDEGFRETERNLEQLKARYKSDQSWATLDAKSNAIELPNVQPLSKSNASHALEDLQPLIEIGHREENTINADSGDLSIDSASVYQEWLLARGGVDISV